MAYKKYIYRDGKKFGPYYYESYRDENGKVRKRYVKRESVENGNEKDDEIFHKKLVMLGIFIFIIGLIAFSWNSFFEEVLFSEESGYGLMGEPIWNCGLCENGIRICHDESDYGYESYSEECVVEEMELEERFVLSSVEKDRIDNDCEINLECRTWGECKIDYNLNNLIEGDVFLEGIQIRSCVDKGGCIFDKVEEKKCNVVSQVVVEGVDKCSKKYVEVRNLDGELISRFEWIDENGGVLNIDISGDEDC